MSTFDTVRDYVQREIIRSPNVTLAEDDRLIERGFLTSLDVINFVMFLEEQFSVTIDPDDVTEDHFQTLRSITRLVEHAGRSPGGD